MSDSIERVLSGKAWNEFCNSLKSAGQTILRPEAPATEIDRSEGWRYLTRLTRIGLEMLFECADPEFPAFCSASHATAKIGADNPDNLYLNAAIDGRHEYRIHGRRGSVHYLSFGSRINRYAIDGTMTETGQLEGGDLAINPDGTFEIVLSETRKSANWLPISAQTNLVIVRQTFFDRSREKPAELAIDCIGGPKWPRPLSAERLDRSLSAVSGFVKGTAHTFADWVQLFQSRPNELLPWDQQMFQRAGGDPNIYYLHGYWRLAPDEALVIETEVPGCKHWNLQLDNHWMESLDYRYLPVHVNSHTARRQADGSVRVVVAHEDPGLPNFLYTAGHGQGSMLLRWVQAECHPQPVCRVVKFASLKDGGSR
ncbi:MAG: DUF1214 domain-containing protein [Steroidobacteraceae bacterium]